ncbi:T9SS type B sorting domain-containing protein [Mariniflexile sp.]|uniref:T9SS type B sorting domain-containing protein n=1 Tax=Mariniflexile sp. TaxID=1979402 RepID=UPI004048648D
MWANKNNVCALILILVAFVGVSQTTAIPDPNFEQALIDLGYDAAPLDGLILTANISGVTNLDVQSRNILNLTGIEGFINLTIFNCDGNLLTNLNISQNTKLTQLFCSDNQLTAVDTSQQINLDIFWCSNNQLTTLDLTNNTKLISLVCANNFLTNLDTTQNNSLNVLVCENNQILSLDVSSNNALSRLQCGTNLLSDLDVSKNPNLGFLLCENNQLSTLDVSTNTLLSTLNCGFNNLQELDLSSNSALTELNCSNNNLCRLNIKNGNNANAVVDFQSNINLNCVVVDNPSGNHGSWKPASFSNYTSSQNQCRNFVNVDTLESVVTNKIYTLPILTYGNYFTLSEGNGTPLFSGKDITTSQTVYIYNESLCATNESSFYVLITSEDYYIPKYFTPNNDGMHDFWKVQDFTNTIESISIFNRYGKLLKSLPSNSSGWNGIFNGKLLVSDTYWYVIALNTGETIKGYFALKR